jgi:amino acid transporter
VSTFILLATYVIVAVAAQAFNGPQDLVEHSDDIFSALGEAVLGSPLDKLLIIAVLTSAAASTQTTILPTARTSLSMARARAMPESLGRIHPRFLTPHISTILMGSLSIVWYVGLTIVSENILFDSIAALGLMIAFYYGLTGFACVLYYRRELLNSGRNFVMIGVVPTLGALMLLGILVKSCIDLSDPANSESGDSWLGLGPPLVIGIGSMLLGVVLMLWWRWTGHREFFRRRPEVVGTAELAASPATGPGD